MRKFWLLLMVTLALAGGAGWWFRVPLAQWWGEKMTGIKLASSPKFHPDPKTYAVLISELERWRVGLAKRHAAATTPTERKAALHDARVILEQALPAMMRCWLGTPWDFHGTASTPGGGQIACGYFVSTVLRDAGFKVDRYQLAKQPSENILRSFLPRASCILTIGQEYGAFAAVVESADPGIYLVGLDTHVAFLVVQPDGFRMIHSSGSQPWCVVDESRNDAHVLQKSNWRMLGNLTRDPQVLKHWLKAEKIVVRGN